MAPLSYVLPGLAFLTAVNAHFNLNTPKTIGFSDDDEGSAPCGGFTPDFSKAVNFHVGGEPIGTTLGHPQANWLYRATLDQTASGNWTQIFPIVQQSGLGAFCEPSVTVDSSWVGKKGVVGVVANAPDGLLYQCSAVNFVSGTGTVDSSTCKNATVQASFTSDSALTALVGGTSTSTNTSSTTSTTSSSPTSSTTKNAAPSVVRGEFSIGGLLMIGVLTALGACLL